MLKLNVPSAIVLRCGFLAVDGVEGGGTERNKKLSLDQAVLGKPERR